MKKAASALVATLALATMATGYAQAVTPRTERATVTHVHSGKWTPVPARMARELGHDGCVWRIGPTSYIRCADGYTTTS